MPVNARFHENGLAALLSGEALADTPPVDGGPRWGTSVILRPTGPLRDELSALGRQAEAIAGPGHWAHPGPTLHVTLRALEPHSTRSSVGDDAFAQYASALDEATDGFGSIDIDFRGVAPHPGGVLVLGRSEPMPRLRRRLVAALDTRRIAHYEQSFVRNLWYVSVLHFAAPLEDPFGLVDWGVRHRDHPVGRINFDRVEVVRWWFVDGAITPEVLHTSLLN